MFAERQSECRKVFSLLQGQIVRVQEGVMRMPEGSRAPKQTIEGGFSRV